MKIIAVTACPTGIAHTYMAAATLSSVGREMGHDVKVETQGAMGIENELRPAEISAADLVIFAADIAIENEARFNGKRVLHVPIREVLKDARKVLTRI
ncbi:MAG: PTS fructose transporter subunit IIB [Telmatospirillum sp.]|nr:PTS fructose transporter subunit IIB [Telmatospirillum sp.]